MKKAGKNIWGIAWPPLLFMGMQVFVSFIYALIHTLIIMVPAVVKTAFESALSGGGLAEFPSEGFLELAMASMNLHIPVIVSACATFLVIFLILKKEWAAAAFWGFKKVRAAPLLLCVSLGVSLNFFISGVMALLPIPDTEQPFEALLGDNLVLMLFSMALISPFLEEVIFRGAVQNRLIKMMGAPGAVILQAFLFGLIHLNLLQGAYAFAIGVIIGAVYLWYGSIWVPVAIHVVFNATSVILSHIAEGAEINGPVFIIITAAAFVISAWSVTELARRKKV